MKYRYAAIPISLIAVMLICTGCVSTETYPSYLSATSTYDLRIIADGPVTNATFCIPLPVKNGIPMVGSRPLSPEDFRKPGFTVSFTQTPPDYPYSGKISDTGSTAWFVTISADSWPANGYDLEIANGSHHLSSSRGFLETRTPIGNESVLQPKLNFSAPILEPEGVLFTTLTRYKNAGSFPQTVPAYEVYFANRNTSLQFSTEIEGSNMWLEGPDQWRDNWYSDSINIRLRGNGTGWYPVSQYTIDGDFWPAYGYYPDLARPEWQKPLT